MPTRQSPQKISPPIVPADLPAAIANPSKYFEAPAEVLLHSELTRKAKIDILRQWETDARLLSVAESENLQGGEPSGLSAVVNALIALGDETQTSEANAKSAKY